MARQLHDSYSQLEQRVADRTQELEALYRADEELYRNLDLDQVLQAIVNVSVDILNADKSTVLAWEDSTGRLVVRASKGFSPETVQQMRFSPGEGLIGQVAVSGKPAVVEDSRNNQDIAIRITELEGIRSFMHLPIKVNERIFGVFNVSYLKPRAFGESEERLFLALAQRASLAIENAQLYEQAQYVAAVEERQRLARELHDAVTQSLFSASLIAEVLNRLYEKNPIEGKRRLEELRHLTRGALAEMRTLLLELRPSALMEAEVSELFRHLCDSFAGRTMVTVNYQLEGDCDLPAEVKIAFYRIAQEALNNIAKHAQASQVGVCLTCRDGSAVMEIQDDGRGFTPGDASPDHLGLGIMQERAEHIGAELSVFTEAGKGTHVRVRWMGMSGG
jgi:signal transduction histidine kinase